MTDKSLQNDISQRLDSGELEQISKILLGLDRAELVALHQKIENQSQFVDHLSNSLGAAVYKASDTEIFQSSMAPIVASGVLKTARQEPMEMGKAIAPALGPAIRGMVTLALENMSQRVDAHIQTNFSLQGLKWRFEAKRTGVPLFDIVMRETLDFRVEHVMLIHQKTGALLAEVSQPDIKTKDPAVVSGMLSAVSDFVVDAFGANDSDDEPQTYKVGDLTAYVERLGDLVLAVVVRGTVSSSLKQMLRERLESICVIYAEAAHRFDGDVEPFESSESMLKDCLVSVAKKKSTDKSKTKQGLYIGIVVLVLIAFLSWFGYGSWLDQKEAEKLALFKTELSTIPGTTLVGFDVADKVSVRMLVDPLAQDPKYLLSEYGYEQDFIDWQLHPYVSLHTDLFNTRVRQLINPPETVAFTMQDGVLSFTGSASHSWLQRAATVAPVISGVKVVDFDQVVDQSFEEVTALAEDIEAVRIEFEYAVADFYEGSDERLNSLKSKLERLDELILDTNQQFQLYVDVDPIEWSDNQARDVARFKRRVIKLSEYFQRNILEGNMQLKNVGEEQLLPYASLRVEFGG